MGETQQIAESLGRSLWERVPGYEISALDRVELIAAIDNSVRAIMTCLTEGRLPQPDELESARTLGERRAIQGVPVESVVGSWHNAERYFIDRLLGTTEMLTAADVREVHRQVGLVVEQMLTVATAAYRDVRGEVQEQFGQASTDIVSSLAGVEPLTATELDRRARLIGAEPQLPHRVLALGTHGADGLSLAKARRLIAETLRPHMVGRLLTGTHQGFQLLVITDHEGVIASVERALTLSGLPADLFGGLGEPRPRLAEASGSLHEAISALQVAMNLDRRLARFEQVVPEVLLRESPLSARTMVRAVLGPIDHGDLIETLRTFLSCGLSVRATARQLHVHENTVAYRVKRIVEAMCVESVNELVQPDILLSLRARELLEES